MVRGNHYREGGFISAFSQRYSGNLSFKHSRIHNNKDDDDDIIMKIRITLIIMLITLIIMISTLIIMMITLVIM